MALATVPTNTTDSPADGLARRLALRGVVQNAGTVIAPVWPIGRFIACNPLHGLEDLPFERAVAEGHALFGGRGYLPNAEYRRQLAEGRIDAARLRAAFERGAAPVGSLSVGAHRIEVAALLWAHLTVGLDAGDGEDAPALREGTASAVASAMASAMIDRAFPEAGLVPAINGHMIAWCAAFLDEGLAAVPMPGRERGFYRAWRDLALHDRSLGRAVKRLGADLAALPAEADAALLDALDRLEVADAERERYLTLHLAALPGWSGHVKWRAEAQEPPARSIDLVQLLAVRVTVERLLVAGFLKDRVGMTAPTVAGVRALVSPMLTRSARNTTPPETRLRRIAEALGLPPDALADASAAQRDRLFAVIDGFPPERHGPIWLEAAEEGYRAALLNRLAPAAARVAATLPEAVPEAARAPAQLVFCIDVRSEPFRRALEAQGPYDTYGFAGFFGVPIRHRPFGGGAAADLCPVLLKPRHDIAEVPRHDHPACAAAHRRGARRAGAAQRVVAELKRNIAAPFGLVEATGALFAPAFAGRTLAPRAFGRLVSRLKAAVVPPVPLAPVVTLAPVDGGLLSGMTLDEQVHHATAAVRVMGLTEPFARLVVFVGHGSTTVNNPYAAALDCGACGGNHGGLNARVLAAICNRAAVRDRLARDGIAVPADTVFLAAEHDTTTDRVTVFDQDAVPATHAADLAALLADLSAAGDATAAERLARLGAPGAGPAAAAVRSQDWAQVRPEWGLARNAAFIVGPRALTKGLDLEGRTFLHSYDWRTDGDGKALEIILTAPMVVAQWINSQYYFSTVDNGHYGSGSKTTHNVVGLIGVMRGNASDLLTGLPWQSVAGEDGRPYHEPLRLMTVVLAPVGRVAAIIARNPILQTLFDNGWVALAVLDPDTGRTLRYAAAGRSWVASEPAAGPLESAPFLRMPIPA